MLNSKDTELITSQQIGRASLFTSIILSILIISCAGTGVGLGEEDNGEKPPVEIWMALKPGSAGDWTKLEWKVVLPDGSYFNQLPREGFLGFSKNQSGGTWGTFTYNEHSGTFQNQYETIQVRKISETELEKVGYANRLYKLYPLEGLKLSGKYNTIPNWSVMSNYPYGPDDPQPMISFAEKGTFKDMGAFVTNFTIPYQDPQRAPGTGTYEIKNFTLILSYADGRKITRSFGGVFNNKVTATSELVFIGGNPFYNK